MRFRNGKAHTPTTTSTYQVRSSSFASNVYLVQQRPWWEFNFSNFPFCLDETLKALSCRSVTFDPAQLRSCDCVNNGQSQARPSNQLPSRLTLTPHWGYQRGIYFTSDLPRFESSCQQGESRPDKQVTTDPRSQPNFTRAWIDPYLNLKLSLLEPHNHHNLRPYPSVLP